MFIIWLFLSIYYVPAWLTCSSPVDAPSNGLRKTETQVLKNTTKWPSYFLDFVMASREKLVNHLCFLSVRFVVLVFSQTVLQRRINRRWLPLWCNATTALPINHNWCHIVKTFKPNCLRTSLEKTVGQLSVFWISMLTLWNFQWWSGRLMKHIAKQNIC